MKHTLKVWLRKLDFSPDPNDYSAVVSPVGSINKSGLIDALMAEGTEYQRETVEDIITRYNRQCATFAVNGWNVDTGIAYMRPVVSGVLHGKKLDPAKNNVYIAMMQGAAIRQEVARTQVEVLGEMPDLMHIMRVTNMQSKAADGTLKRGRNAQVEGAFIKITGSDPTVGVYLVNVDDGTQTHLDDDCVVMNHPSKLLILVPAELPVGAYRLKVVSQFSSGNKLLKTPRETTYSRVLELV